MTPDSHSRPGGHHPPHSRLHVCAARRAAWSTPVWPPEITFLRLVGMPGGRKGVRKNPQDIKDCKDCKDPKDEKARTSDFLGVLAVLAVLYVLARLPSSPL